MPHRILILLFVLLSIASGSLAAQPGAPVVRGVSRQPAATIVALFTSLRYDSAVIAVQRLYASAGMLATSVERDSSGAIVITEGSVYTVRSVSYRPDSLALMLETGGVRRPFVGRPFAEADVNDEMLTIVHELNGRGYPLATARLLDVRIDDSAHAVDMTVELVPGERVRISKVDVRGNTSTKTSLILTAAAVPHDALFSDELAQQVRRRLERLNLFSEVSEPQLFRSDSGVYGLFIAVKEGTTNTFDGVVGLQPADSGGSVTLTGLVNVSFRNIFGTGRRLALRWQKLSTTASQLELRYGEPFLFSLPLDLDIGFSQNQEASTPVLLSYVQRSFFGNLYYGLTDAFTVKLGAAYQTTIPQSDSTQPCTMQLLNTSTLETSLGIVYDTRSSTVNPMSGVRYNTSYAVGAESVRGPSRCADGYPASDTRGRLEADLECYVPMFKRFVAVGAAHYGDVTGALVEEADLFRMGGQSTVRGYLENAILASQRIWGNAEFRMLLAPTSYVGLFTDYGYYLRREDLRKGISQQTGWLLGYGVSAQIETPLGLMKLSYALSRDDTFATGKVFVGLVNQF
ncbi:MAG TPA: BamA/TamA family outer membrane protein [Candidatus Kapabacteria bacterium]|nr:BamA/TamA family outer membrane protein [Candidatus Kapabacteria bacterium]